MGMAAQGLPNGVTPQTFQDPPNAFRLVQYKLSPESLREYPRWGIGGYMGFFYKNLYKQGPGGDRSIGPLVDAAYSARGDRPRE